MNTKMCTNGIQHLRLIITCIIFQVLLISCSSERPESRPSPLAADSISIGDTQISIVYSSPRVRARKIWGDLVPYNKLWRTGANEATYIELSSDIKINNQLLPKGKYSIFTIPGEEDWTIIFNEVWDQWGFYFYDEKKDKLRIIVPTSTKEDISENMEFSLSEDRLSFQWEYLTFELNIETIN